MKLQYTAIIHICGEHVVSFPLAVFDGLLYAHCILHTASDHNWQWEWPENEARQLVIPGIYWLKDSIVIGIKWSNHFMAWSHETLNTTRVTSIQLVSLGGGCVLGVWRGWDSGDKLYHLPRPGQLRRGKLVGVIHLLVKIKQLHVRIQ